MSKENPASKWLHIGCGTNILRDWVNIDIVSAPGIDLVLDIRQGLPFDAAEYIFAEHFIEHLDFQSGLEFLQDCRRILTDRGVLRLSTPNLDWVWLNQYHYNAWADASEAVRDCFWMNRAFHGWGHQFLYNRQTLGEVLLESGFKTVECLSYGESRHAALRGLECHETYIDTPETPHIVVVEASGRSSTTSRLLAGPSAEFAQAMAVRSPE
jgi:predicted SAM-dependent methyltransferase